MRGTSSGLRSIVGGMLCIPILLSLTACTLLETPDRPAPTRFLIEDGRPAAESLPSEAPSLVVDPISAGTAYDSSDMLYLSDGELQRFAMNRWAAPPADMLQSVLLRSLERTGAFSVVLAGPVSARPDLVLESELEALRQEFDDGSSQIRLRLRVQMVDRSSGETLLARSFETTEDAGGGPATGAEAANRAAARLADTIAERVAAATAER